MTGSQWDAISPFRFKTQAFNELTISSECSFQLGTKSTNGSKLKPVIFAFSIP